MAKAAFNYEILSQNVDAGYVTYILDIWEGAKDDPATSVERFLGLWTVEQLEAGELDEGLSVASSYYSRNVKPEPAIWECIATVRQEDRGASGFKRDQDSFLDEDSYRYGREGANKDMYIAFMEAIDKLAADDTDAEAWKTVDAWFDRRAYVNEK